MSSCVASRTFGPLCSAGGIEALFLSAIRLPRTVLRIERKSDSDSPIWRPDETIAVHGRGLGSLAPDEVLLGGGTGSGSKADPHHFVRDLAGDFENLVRLDRLRPLGERRRGVVLVLHAGPQHA